MRYLITTGLAACLLVAGVSPATAQESPPGPAGMGGRVEMPEFGFAITYPDDWAWVRHTAQGEDEVVALLADVTDPDYANEYRPLLAVVDESFPVTGTRYPTGEDEGAYCGVGVVPTDLSLEEAVANVVDYYGSDEDTFPGGATTTEITLSGDEAFRIEYLQMQPGWTVPWHQVQYTLMNDSVLYYVACSGIEVPDDRWLSVAETLETWPAAGASQAPRAQADPQPAVTMGGRVEVSDAGYAMAAPDGWVTILPTAADAKSIIDTLREIDPELAATTENALAGGVGFSLLMFGDFDTEQGFRQNCNVIDYASEGMPLDSIVAADIAAFEDMGERLARGPESASLELPAGEVAQLVYGLQYPQFQTAHAAYYFIDGATVHLLTCTDTERSEDEWRSVAETFELLPDD